MKKRIGTVVVLLLVVGLSAPAAWYWRGLRRERAITDWFRTHAIRLETVDPLGDLADLQPLAPVIGDARIVGAGEATHGTREHFLYKHRLLRFLVTQKGFRALAFESPWPTGLALNQHILGGEGDPERLLRQAVFGVWHSQEVLDTMLWMREYNATVRPEQRVEFVGIDIQLTRVAARAVAQYLDRVDPQFRARHARTIDLLAAKEMEGLYLEFVDNVPKVRPRNSETRTISAVVREVLARFDAQRERFIAASSASEFDIARQHANILVQQADVCEDWSSGDRDRYMADNLDWYMARRPGVKVMIWAHNGHVAFDPNPNRHHLGRHMKDRHGKAYVSVGFVLGSGSYGAVDAWKTPVGRRPRSATFTFGPPPARTLNALMAATGKDIFAVDLRSARGRVRELLERPLRIRIGYGIVMRRDPLNTIKLSLPATHDVLIFIDHTTPARSIRSIAPQRHSPAGGRPAISPKSRGDVFTPSHSRPVFRSGTSEPGRCSDRPTQGSEIVAARIRSVVWRENLARNLGSAPVFSSKRRAESLDPIPAERYRTEYSLRRQRVGSNTGNSKLPPTSGDPFTPPNSTESLQMISLLSEVC